MSALFFSLVCAFLFLLPIKWDAYPAWVGGLLFMVAMIAMAGFYAYCTVWEWRRNERRNRDAFVREVVLQHQRANEARQATERA